MIEIRQATGQDVYTIFELGANVTESHTSDQAPNFWPIEILHNCIGKEDVYFFAATSNKEIVGFVIANSNKSLSKVLIENIFVKHEFRGRGIGARLAKKVVETARTDGYQFISVLTPPDDIAAIKAYEKAGFAKGETFLWLDVV